MSDSPDEEIDEYGEIIVIGDDEDDDDFDDEDEDDFFVDADDADANSEMTVDESSDESESSRESDEIADHMDHENSDNAVVNPNPPNQPSTSQQNQTGANLSNVQPVASTSTASTASTNTAVEIAASQMDSENTCIICTEMWTTSDVHHLVALKCGHLFGKSCIENWLAPSRNYNRCPQCNKPAKRRDIYKIYSRCVKPLDTWERDEVLAKNKVLEQQKHSLEMEKKQAEALIKRLQSENDALQVKVMNLQAMKSNNSATSIDANIKNFVSSRTTMFKLKLFRDFAINEGNCRRHCYSTLTESLAISTTSLKQDNSMFPKYGVKKIPLNAMGKTEMLNIHTKSIRDMVINQYDSTIASVSLDKTVKITSLMSKETVFSATLEVDPWSVHLYETKPNFLYIGLNGGGIQVRDRRKFSESILSLAAPTQTPVYSLSTIEYGETNKKKSALLSVQPNCCSLFIFSNGADLATSDYKVEKLPMEGRFASTWFDAKSGLSSLSCRPSPKHGNMTHLVLSFLENSSSDLMTNIVNIFEGGNVSTIFPRTKMYTNPLNEENVILCTGDEASKGAIFWDYNANRNSFNTQQISQQPVFDIEMFNERTPTPIISCLSENTVKLYKLTV